jgi:hypothetical protein
MMLRCFSGGLSVYSCAGCQCLLLKTHYACLLLRHVKANQLCPFAGARAELLVPMVKNTLLMKKRKQQIMQGRKGKGRKSA